MVEEWRDVVGFEVLYEVSNLGRVKSHKGRNDKILTPIKCGKGYLQLILCADGKHKNVMIHRMVAKAFIPNPNEERTVNHKDGNKKNNCVDNLEWCSYSDNLKHAYANGLNHWNPKKGRKQTPVVKMDLHTHEILGEYESIGDAFRSLEEYGNKPVRCGSIARCCRGVYKSAHGYFWRFKESEE